MRKVYAMRCRTCGLEYTSLCGRPSNCRVCGRAEGGRKKREGQAARLLALVAAATRDQCVEWPYGRDNNGYGNAMIGRRPMKAHRAIYILLNGEVPADLEVMHACDNRGCVNPHHLSLGTHADNMRDAANKGRIRSACGEAHYKARLTATDVVAIRASDARQVDLAAAYGISQAVISSIKLRKIWKSVP
jgi:hypothetical protein